MIAVTGYEVAAIILATCVGLALIVLALGWTLSKTPPEVKDAD